MTTDSQTVYFSMMPPTEPISVTCTPLQSPHLDFPYSEEVSPSTTSWRNGDASRSRCVDFLRHNAVQRVLSAAVLAPAVTVFLWLSPAFATTTVCSFLTSTCSYEYACLANRIRLRILTRLEAMEGTSEGVTRCSRFSSDTMFHHTRSDSVSAEEAEEEAEASLTPRTSSDTTTRIRSSVGRNGRALQEEREELEIAEVDCELRDQEDRLNRCAVTELAARYFQGHEWVAAVWVALLICVVITATLLFWIQRIPELQTTEFYEYRWTFAIATGFVVGLSACFTPDWHNAEAFVTFMQDVVGLVYITGTLSILVSFVDDDIRILYRKLLIALLYIVWASDTGAYLVGKTLAFFNYPYYNPLAPHLSNNKDYEGTLGAIVFGIAAMVVASDILNLPGSFGTKVTYTVIAVVAGRLGDLFESLLKRAAGVKDSGKIIPGHGGALDRIDALMFATVVFSRYYALHT
ncbi:hypothetical protein PF008_g20741 [Phytophthora fragariae]|uniref:Phosphatidate cytidylyltransferase n=1 Tax=Phytophthora fragariae TaxID=53985 RepID=A0A6G0QYU8_9STRA|nr:hypothetical protein PF008_g20741 [Phytophthora fragariae]